MRLFVSVALVAACLAAPAALAQVQPAAVIPIKDFAFGPMLVTVPVGASVTWNNNDGEPHTVVAAGGEFRSPALDQGDSFTFKFTKAGEYAYICSIHPQMKAKVVVR